MANVNTNQHSASLIEYLWELEVVQVTTSLAVNLFNNVGGFGEVELVSILKSHNLGGNAVLEHYFFKHLVVALTLKNTEHDNRVTELASTDVLADFRVELTTVVFFLHLDPVGLLDLDSELF